LYDKVDIYMRIQSEGYALNEDGSGKAARINRAENGRNYV